jgi:molybdenum cofactor cytidylyltransferase
MTSADRAGAATHGIADEAINPVALRIAAVILAAGRSTRMGDINKLLCDVGGRSLIARVADSACASRCRPVVLVSGFDSEAVRAAVSGYPLDVVFNPDFGKGMATSLRCGLMALPDEVNGALILLGDMPRISAQDIDRLIDAFDTAHPHVIIPEFEGRRGNPVLWPKKHFARLVSLEGDIGGRRLLDEIACECVRISFDVNSVLADIDSRADLAELTRR